MFVISVVVKVDPDKGVRTLTNAVPFTNPARVGVTASIHLERIGTIGLPLDFGLPIDHIASGRTPLILENAGEFEMPGGFDLLPVD